MGKGKQTEPEDCVARDTIKSPSKPHQVPGFDLQQYKQKVTQPLKTTSSKLETSRLARLSLEYSPTDLLLSKNTSPEYRLWQEASHIDPPYPDHYDPEYNSNVWRNFATKANRTQSHKGRVAEQVAKMHPLPIPAYNRLGRYTYAKFLSEVTVIPDQKKNQGEIIRHLSDLKEYRKLKLRSEVRRPPIDVQGRIVPPSTMKKYERRFTASPEPVGLDSNPPYYIVDIRDKVKLEHPNAFPTRYIFKENYPADDSQKHAKFA